MLVALVILCLLQLCLIILCIGLIRSHVFMRSNCLEEIYLLKDQTEDLKKTITNLNREIGLRLPPRPYGVSDEEFN